MDTKPNILLITSDHHRAEALSCAGHPCIRTPHLDAIARDGIQFTRAYTDCPVCIPSRTTLITGIQSHVYGMPSYEEHYRINRKREDFLGSLMTRAGYQTQLVGKTHWHTDTSFRAGFETVIKRDRLMKERVIRMGRPTNMHGLGGNESHPMLSQFPPELQTTDWIVDQCIQFLDERDRTQPFFLWASFFDPHPPFSIHEPYYSMYDDADIPEAVLPAWVGTDNEPVALYRQRWQLNPGPMSSAELKKARAVYYGMITNIDHQLGRLVGKLIWENLWDNTWVFYTSDHGDHLGDHGIFGKRTFLDFSARIPFIVRPPRDVSMHRGHTNAALVEMADLLPTFCDLASVEPPDDITGQCLTSLISDTDQQNLRDSLHGQIDYSHMFIAGKYKYLYFVEDGAELLFDTQHDPLEQEDLSEDAALIAVMREQFIDHLKQEEHPHLYNGELRNLQQPKPPLNVVRNQLAALAWQSSMK